MDTERYKLLQSEWDSVKNTKKLSDYTKGSHYRAYWTHTCKCGERHEWTQQVKQRLLKNENCPYCSKIPKKLCKCRSLAYLYPEIAKQWHPKNDVQPTEVFARSPKKYWWLCDKSKCIHPHEWISTIADRTRGQGCCFCIANRKKVCICDSFYTKFPEIAKEWHPTKNKDLEDKGYNLKNITFKSSHNVWWKCIKGHEYRSRISDRIRSDSRQISCSKCNGTTSFGEREVAKMLDKLNIKYITQKFINVDGIVLKFDFYLVDYNKAIEFDGELHFRVTKFFGGEEKYKRTQYLDNLKTFYCAQKRIHLLRIHWKDLKIAENLILEFIDSNLGTTWYSQHYPI